METPQAPHMLGGPNVEVLPPHEERKTPEGAVEGVGAPYQYPRILPYNSITWGTYKWERIQ
jgi:hypothetical protein